jgi:hypothetical protein
MAGRGFLEVAREVVAGTTEYHWRAAVIHAYYALILECRDALLRWGFAVPRRDIMHAQVRLRFTYATDSDLKEIGRALDTLVRERNRASYDLTPGTKYASSTTAQRAIKEASNALDLLDDIDGDANRRAAAIATIQP